MAEPRPTKQPAEWARAWVQALDFPFLLIGSTLGGGALGYFLDERLRISPVMTLLFGFVGFGIGLGAVLQSLGERKEKR